MAQHHEIAELTSNRIEHAEPGSYTNIAANSWNQTNMRALNDRLDSSLPAAFGNIDLIAQAPAIEAAITPFITPKTNLETIPVARGNDGFELFDPSKNIAQNYQDIRQSGLSTDIPRIVDPRLLDKAAYRFEHPFRGQELQELGKIPAPSWNETYKAFPELGKYFSPEEGSTLIKALVANELDHYNWIDKKEDELARSTHSHLLHALTLGDSQISPDAVQKWAKEFELEVKEGKRRLNPLADLVHASHSQLVEALEDRTRAPQLVAACLAHNLRMYENHGIPVTEQTMAYGFNPDVPKKGPHNLLPNQATLDNSTHVKNVLNWIDKLK